MVECCNVVVFVKRDAVKKHKRRPLRDSAFWGRGLKSQPMYSRANRWNWEIPLLLVFCEDFTVAFLNNTRATVDSSRSPVTCPKYAIDASGP